MNDREDIADAADAARRNQIDRAEQMDRLYDLLVVAVRAGLPAPTNAEIARAIGFRSEGKASELLGRLETSGRVRVDRRHDWRIVHLVDLGIATAPPPLRALRPTMVRPPTLHHRTPPQPPVFVDPATGVARPVPAVPGFAPERPRPVVSRFKACQWIDGDTREDRVFCGAATEPGKPYCCRHAARAYCEPGTTRYDAYAITAARRRIDAAA